MSPWTWWTCDLTYTPYVCRGFTLENVTPSTGFGLGCQPGDSGNVIPGTMSGDVCHPIDSTNVTPGAGSGGGHPEDYEHVNPGA